MSMTLLVTSVMASPAAVSDPAPGMQTSVRSVAETDLIAETIIFGVESAKCKIRKCAKIVVSLKMNETNRGPSLTPLKATAACILGTLADLESTLACVIWNSEAVSTCEMIFVVGGMRARVLANYGVSFAIALGVSRSWMVGSRTKASATLRYARRWSDNEVGIMTKI